MMAYGPTVFSPNDMDFLKTTADFGSKVQDALTIDRKETVAPQTFTKEQLLDIQTNTNNHKTSLEAMKGTHKGEYDFYVKPGEDGKSVIDKALEELSLFLNECTILGIL